MEEELFETTPEAEARDCTPRPVWQVWAARIGLIVFIAFLIMYYVNIAGGGN